MKKYLITGASGFVGRYFLRFLDTLDTPAHVIGITRTQEKFQIYKNLQLTIELADLTNRLRIQDILAYYRPDYVVHLASDSSVAYSWKYPIDSFHNNTNIFLNLLESIRVLQIPCRVLSVGSSEEYGIVSGHTIPLKETAMLNPISPYAVARVSQELLSKVYADSFGIDIVLTRSFNHIGPEQKEAFVISSFAKQVIQAKLGLIHKITTGQLDIIRDFLDVRDVVKAYFLLLEKGLKGEVYNVCSGSGISLSDVLKKMCTLVNVPFDTQIIQTSVRPNDNPIIIGDNQKIRHTIEWTPTLSLDNSLGDILTYWEHTI